MLRGVEVLGRVLVLRAVATAHMPAAQAKSQVQPGVAHFQALFAALPAGMNFADLIDVFAGLAHGKSPVVQGARASLRPAD
jgi:hypothetical protein